jgi:DNA-binding NarL/FixJ family response regulator
MILARLPRARWASYDEHAHQKGARLALGPNPAAVRAGTSEGFVRERAARTAGSAGPARTAALAAPIQVVVGEDNFIAREGLVRVLEDVDGVEIMAVCADLPSVQDAVERFAPDVVLADIRMPPSFTDEGIRLAGELRSTHPSIGVIVLSQHVEPLYALALFDERSDGRAYLLKDRIGDAAELGRAVREVAAGGALVDPQVVDALLARSNDRTASSLARLTPRERETLALVAEGRSNNAIAEALGIGVRAVENYVNAIFAKLDLTEPHGVNRRVKATLLYLAAYDELRH